MFLTPESAEALQNGSMGTTKMTRCQHIISGLNSGCLASEMFRAGVCKMFPNYDILYDALDNGI